MSVYSLGEYGYQKIYGSARLISGRRPITSNKFIRTRSVKPILRHLHKHHISRPTSSNHKPAIHAIRRHPIPHRNAHDNTTPLPRQRHDLPLLLVLLVVRRHRLHGALLVRHLLAHHARRHPHGAPVLHHSGARDVQTARMHLRRPGHLRRPRFWSPNHRLRADHGRLAGHHGCAGRRCAGRGAAAVAGVQRGAGGVQRAGERGGRGWVLGRVGG